MQFFPSDSLNQFGSYSESHSVLPFASGSGGGYSYASGGANGENSFANIFQTNLQEYNKNNNAGIPAGFRSVKDDHSQITSSDLKNLAAILKKQGVKEETTDKYISQVNVLFGGITIGNLNGTAKMLAGRQQSPLNKQERAAFTALMNKMGFSAEEAQELENLSFYGEGKQLLEAIKEKLGNQKLSLNQDDMALICRAADLSGDSSMAIMQLFSGMENIDLSQETFDKIFGPAMAELQVQADQLAKLQQALPGAIQEMLDVRSKTKETASSDNKSSRKSEMQEIIARENATSFMDDEEEDEYGNRLIRSKSMAANILDGDKQNSSLREKAFGVNSPQTEADRLNQKNTQEKAEAAPEKRINSRESGFQNTNTGGEHGFERNGKEKATDTRSTLAAKVDVVSGAFFTSTSGTDNSTSAMQQAKTSQFNERIFDQVEKGIVRNLSEGSKQIVLRLDPPELGKLTLSLTLAHGEVKAVIRTESTATTQVINEQLAQLKTSLEEQGFKVASLEVETRTPSHAGTDSWNGMEQHNQQQEMQEQSRFLRLARTRNKESDVLAQSMQHSVQPESISASGLHIIA